MIVDERELEVTAIGLGAEGLTFDELRAALRFAAARRRVSVAEGFVDGGTLVELRGYERRGAWAFAIVGLVGEELAAATARRLKKALTLYRIIGKAELRRHELAFRFQVEGLAIDADGVSGAVAVSLPGHVTLGTISTDVSVSVDDALELLAQRAMSVLRQYAIEGTTETAWATETWVEQPRPDTKRVAHLRTELARASTHELVEREDGTAALRLEMPNGSKTESILDEDERAALFGV